MAAGDVTAEVLEKASENSCCFDGVDDYVKLDSGSLLDVANNDFTISLWFYLDENASDNGAAFVLMEKQLTQFVDGERSYGIFQSSSDDKLRGQIDDDTTGLFPATSQVPVLKAWNHVLITKKSDDFTIYLNNVQGTSEDPSAQGDMSSIYSTYIGRSFSSAVSDFFSGCIRDVRFYNRYFDATDVENLYKGFRVDDGLIAHYPLNDDASEVVNDTTTEVSGAVFRSSVANMEKFVKLNRASANDKFIFKDILNTNRTLAVHVEES